MTKEQFEEIVEKGYDGNYLFLIGFTKEELESFTSPKIKGWIQACIRKQLLSDNLEITLAGKELLNWNRSALVPIIPKKDVKELFEEWWEVFPSSDYFIHKGKTFAGSRAMKIHKNAGSPSDCTTNFKKIVNEGKYTGEDIIRATKFHIETAKDLSVKLNENKLSFIPASERYLRIQAFAPYVELSKKTPVKSESNTFEL